MRHTSKLGIITICITMAVSLSACGSQNTGVKQSVLDVLQKQTIYTTKSIEEAETELNSKALVIDDSNTEQQSLIEYNTNISIKDSGYLNISVDNVKHTMTVSSEQDGKAEEVYNIIINELTSNKDKYIQLWNSIETDENGNITNIVWDGEKDTITFNFDAFGKVDTRILELWYTSYNAYSIVENKKDNKNILVLSDTSNEENAEYYVFKDDAIYGVAKDDKGVEALEKLRGEYSGKVLQIGNNVYLGVDIDSTIETVESVIEYPRIEGIALGTLNDSIEEKEELIIYINDNTIQFKEDICEYLESAGYEPVISDKKRTSNLVIGYTWLHNDSICTETDDSLSARLINHHNKSGIAGESVDFILRTSWELR